MVKKKHNNGFTLVEIIVSIAIFSALLAVLGSIMISGFKYFYETSSTDLDKRTIDEIASYVRSELLYATDVVVQENKPDESNWNSLTVIDGKLHQFEETDAASIDLNLFSNNSFYNNHSFKLSVKGYENKRLDLIFSMNNDKETLYTTKDTLELLNLKTNNPAPFGDFEVVDYSSITTNKMKIYYKKTKENVNNTIVSTGKGTVDDIQLIADGYNFRGKFDVLDNYLDGEIIWYDGYYWQNINGQNNNTIPGTNYAWKRLTRSYTHPDRGDGNENKLCSGYEENDIIVYKNRYYRVKPSISINNSYAADIFQQWDGKVKNEYWEDLGEVGNLQTEKIVQENKYYPKKIYNQETIWARFFPKKMDITDPTYSTIKSFENGKVYKKGDIIKKVSSDSRYYYLYVQRLNTSTGDVGNPENGWTKIDVAYDENSYYEKGDIVWLLGHERNSFFWIEATNNITKSYDSDYVYKSLNNSESTEYDHNWIKIN